jgi:acetyl/propionyl-CoA carboxylase alpha subunit
LGFAGILIANRGEVAIRVARAATGLGVRSVAVFSEDDAASLHVRAADACHALAGRGARAYLDIDAIIAAAKATGCDAIHPGYGFLSEQADFARACEAAGITFIGPKPEHLELFGDKARARRAASALGIPVSRGLDHAVTLDEARDFFNSLGKDAAMMIKAVAGGGGRGARAVLDAGDLDSAYKRCRSEAKSAFGVDEVYVEAFLPRARHVEVQIVGDLAGHVNQLGERECSVQRRFQKVVEIAPSAGLEPEVRAGIIAAALRFAADVRYSSLGTFEFLVDASGRPGGSPFVFIEANARLQVEHTVTEAVTGVDLVQSQIRIASGDSLASLGLDDPEVGRPRGYAIQARVNLESIGPDGSVRPGSGTLSLYEPPGGPGVRTDGFGYTGYTTSTAFDSLLAKVIGHAPTLAGAAVRTARALDEFRIAGVKTNIPFLHNVLAHPDFAAGRIHTRWVDEHIASLAEPPADRTPRFHEPEPAAEAAAAASPSGHAGARVADRRDPLALFDHAAKVSAEQAPAAVVVADAPGPAGTVGLSAPIQGTIVALHVDVGDTVRKGQPVAIVEAMKMEHVITATQSGIVREVTMAVGDIVREGFPIVFVEPAEVEGGAVDTAVEVDPDYIRPDLAEAIARHALTLDEHRPEAVAKRKARGYRMPRENIAQLLDPGSFKEYGALTVAQQHQRYDMETLRKNTPADGMIAGTGSINGHLFGEERSRAIVLHYDYTVLAGTQGRQNHRKQDRMLELAKHFRIPVVLFGEGGGGRPGDDDIGPNVPFESTTYRIFSQLSGLVPLVTIVNGRVFAGNTALVAACDVIIATEGTTIAMGGPAMIEGGGLGIYTPEEVGPLSFQVPNGVVDIVVKDEREAVEVAKKYLSYFQGPISTWEAHDQRRLRHIVPENRLRLYDMREVLHTIADRGSVLEIREKFGIGMITAFIRVEGRPLGVIANNPHHLSGAIDSDGADKGARFMQLCDAFDIPVLSLMDCPGIMVGPDAERTALVRHSVRMFNAGANFTAPMFCVVVRKSYGLGALAMIGGGGGMGFFQVGWPTSEYAGMNIEGEIKLGYRRELAAIADPEERRKEFERRVAEEYEKAKAVNAGSGVGLDDVIDPAETRDWIVSGLKQVGPPPPRPGKKHPYVDPW